MFCINLKNFPNITFSYFYPLFYSPLFYGYTIKGDVNFSYSSPNLSHPLLQDNVSSHH